MQPKTTLSGKDIPVVFCKQVGKQWIVEKCPYCGKKHYHGIGAGHRVSHCTGLPDNPGYILKLKE